ncbi:MAG: IS110 family transposase [bacterium]
MSDSATKSFGSEAQAASLPPLTAGLDVGDRHSTMCFIDAAGETVERTRVRTTSEALRGAFGHRAPLRIALEVGTHSRWIRRLLVELGHEVFVANPRRVRAIYESDTKTDSSDAEMLARLARVDPKLLCPVRHRREDRARALAVVRSRDGLVRARTLLINHVRGAIKPVGGRVKHCSSESFARQAPEQIPAELQAVLQPVIEQIGHLTRTVREFDRQIEQLCEQFPDAQRLREIPSVGPVTALTFVLTVDDPARFQNARMIGPYLGLCPRRKQSGRDDPQLGITKAGDSYLRKLVVTCAQHTLGPFGKDSALRRWGLQRAGSGDRIAKKKAVVGVARRLTVVMLHLWVSGETYRPFPTPAPPARPPSPEKTVEKKEKKAA